MTEVRWTLLSMCFNVPRLNNVSVLHKAILCPKTRTTQITDMVYGPFRTKDVYKSLNYDVVAFVS